MCLQLFLMVWHIFLITIAGKSQEPGVGRIKNQEPRARIEDLPRKSFRGIFWCGIINELILSSILIPGSWFLTLDLIMLCAFLCA